MRIKPLLAKCAVTTQANNAIYEEKKKMTLELFSIRALADFANQTGLDQQVAARCLAIAFQDIDKKGIPVKQFGWLT